MNSPKYRVYICCGRNCGPKGARQLVDFLEAEVVRLSLEERVVVYPGGCQDHCDSGPTMVVYPGPVFYQEVDRHRIRRIASEHLANDKPVTEYFWAATDRPKPGFRPIKIVLDPPAQRSTHEAPHQHAPHNEQKQSKKPSARKTYEVDDFKW